MDTNKIHKLFTTSKRGYARCVKFEVQSPARVVVAEFEKGGFGWVRLRAADVLTTEQARDTYKQFVAAGYKADILEVGASRLK